MFEETEKDKIEPLIAKFEAYCLPKKNVTHKRHLKKRPDGPVEQFLTELKRLAKHCEHAELSEKLNLVQRTFPVEQENSSCNLTGSKYNKAKLCEKYQDCFEGLGCLLHSIIELRDDAMPVIEPCRKIPFAQYDKLKAELQRMEAM